MTYCPTRWYGAATPIIRGQVLNDAKVGCSKHMQAMIHTCLASFHNRSTDNAKFVIGASQCQSDVVERCLVYMIMTLC